MKKLICALIGAAALVASATTYIQTSSTGTAPWKPVKDSVSQAHLADSALHAPPSAYADSSRASGLADSAKRAGWAPLDTGRVRGIVSDTATAMRGAMGTYLPLAGGRMSGKLRLSAPYGTGIDFLQYHATYGGVRLWHYGDASTYVGMKFSAIDTNGGSLTLPVWVVADVFAGYLHGSADSSAYSSTATNALSLGGVAAANYGTLAQDTLISKKVASDTATVLRAGIAAAITTSEAYATARISDSLTANARAWTTLTAAKSSIHDTAATLRSNMAGYLPLIGGTLTGFLTGTSAELWTNKNAHDYGPALTLHGSIYTSEANLLLRSSTGYGNFLGFSDQSKSAGLQRWNFGVESDTLQIQANSASDGIGGTLVFKLSRNGNLTIPGTLTASSLSGNAATATKLSAARTIATSGDVTGTPTAFDGTANITIPTALPTLLTAGSAGSATTVPTLTWDAKGRLTAVGSAAISIPHTQINDWAASVSSVYLPLAGGTMTGNLNFANVAAGFGPGLVGTIADNDAWRIIGYSSAADGGSLEIATADGGNEPIYVRQYQYNSSTPFGTLVRSASLLNESGNTSFPGTVYATSVRSTGTESISSFALSGDVLTLSHANGDLTWVNTIRGSAGGLVLQNAIISGTFSPEVNRQSSTYTITRADQGKMVTSIYTLNLPSLTEHDAGFWCLVNWHVGGGSATFGPTTSGTTWILRGQYVYVSTSMPFTGIVSWDGYNWYAG